MNASTLVQKLWNYCNILRDDGLSYGDYVEQLTFLLFLKMADEKTKPPFDQKPIIEAPWHWPELLKLDADPLEVHYRHTLEALEAQASESQAQVDLFAAPAVIETPSASAVEAALAALDPDAMSPREALDALYQLKKLGSTH